MANFDHIQISSARSSNPDEPVTILSAAIQGTMSARLYLGDEILHAIVNKFAEKYVEENYAEIAVKLNPLAIANLAIAHASGLIFAESKPTKKDNGR